MIKLSRLTDYAVVVLTQLAQAETLDKNRQMTAPELAAATGIPEPTVSKVLKLLAKPGVVKSTRGVYGGYTLDKPASQVTVASIITALDGPIALTACVEGSDDVCNYQGCCPLKGRWQKVNNAIHAALENLTLADLMPVTVIPIPLQQEIRHGA